MRAVVRNAARHNGRLTKLVWQRRKVKQRPLVIIADISGSMEKYARLYLGKYPDKGYTAQVKSVLAALRARYDVTRRTPDKDVRAQTDWIADEL